VASSGIVGILAALALACAAPGAAVAGGLSISPVTIDFHTGERARAIEVSNPGDAPIDVQVRLFGWRVDQGGEHYTPSADVGFSPPMFRLEPGQRQVVRLALQRPPEGRELSYRLFVDQLPGPPREGGEVQMPVRMVLPVFIAAAKGAEVARPAADARLEWRARRIGATGRVQLIAQNLDVRRVKLVNLALGSEPKILIQKGLAGYVLAGQERAWDLPDPGPARMLTVSAETDEAPLSAHVAIAPD